MINYKLDWSTIYYHDELDTDNSVLYTEYVQEAKYKDGYLVRSSRISYEDGKEVYCESMTFVSQAR